MTSLTPAQGTLPTIIFATAAPCNSLQFKGYSLSIRQQPSQDTFEKNARNHKYLPANKKLQQPGKKPVSFKATPNPNDYWNYPDAFYEKYGYLPQEYIDYQKKWYDRPHYYSVYPIEVRPIPVYPRAIPIGYLPAAYPFNVSGYPVIQPPPSVPVAQPFRQ